MLCLAAVCFVTAHTPGVVLLEHTDSCELIYPICCDNQLHDDSHYCCESEHPVCCKSGTNLWCCGADTHCGNFTGSCTPCSNAATPCASIKTQHNCTAPRCLWKNGKCGDPPAPPPGPPPPPPPGPNPPPPPPLPSFSCHSPPDGNCKTLTDGSGTFKTMADCVKAKSCAVPPAPPPVRKPDWPCPQGGKAQWRMDGKEASAACVFVNNTAGLKMPPTGCGTNCDVSTEHHTTPHHTTPHHTTPHHTTYQHFISQRPTPSESLLWLATASNACALLCVDFL